MQGCGTLGAARHRCPLLPSPLPSLLATYQRWGHEAAASRQLEGHPVDIQDPLCFQLVQEAIQGDQRPHLAHATTAKDKGG